MFTYLVILVDSKCYCINRMFYYSALLDYLFIIPNPTLSISILQKTLYLTIVRMSRVSRIKQQKLALPLSPTLDSYGECKLIPQT